MAKLSLGLAARLHSSTLDRKHGLVRKLTRYMKDSLKNSIKNKMQES